MKKALIFVGLLILSSSCFAMQEYYYAEYSFDDNETSEISSSSLNYSFVFLWTKAEIQAYDGGGWGTELIGYLSRMLRAGADKRIFIIEEYRVYASGEPYRAWGLLFIKINANEYLVFNSGL